VALREKGGQYTDCSNSGRYVSRPLISPALSPPGFRSSLVQVLICRQVSVDGGMSAFLKVRSYLPWRYFDDYGPNGILEMAILGRLRVRGKGLRPS
jgi:hypothetical protein